MDVELLEQLLNEDESATLDFKQGHYAFAGATNEQKSELLKDILAFANAWRRTEAYVLIGVTEVRGGKGQVVGVTDHLDEASLQQFVDSKTNRPVEFSYEVVHVEGVHIGVIRIPVQERPFFLLKNYGRLTAREVYIRRGSSTAIADPDEIARMRLHADISFQSAQLSIEFADVNNHRILGPSASISLAAYSIPNSVLFIDYVSRAQEGGRWNISVGYLANKDYYREYANYLSYTSTLMPFRLSVHNSGSLLVHRALIVIRVDKNTNMLFREEQQYPERPVAGVNLVTPLWNEHLITESQTDYPGKVIIADRSEDWEISITLGDIQPKATIVSDLFYIFSADLVDRVVDLDAILFMDEGDPLEMPLAISLVYDLTPITSQVTLEQIIDANERREEQRLNEEIEKLRKLYG